MSKPKVAVAMSGGVDSSVSALLLHEKGFDVFGLTMDILGNVSNASRDARRVCRDIGISHYFIDLAREFEEEVINPFVEIYHRGETPNPCVLCNRIFKFGYLLRKAFELGAEYLATGHYVRVGRIFSGNKRFIENHESVGCKEGAGSRFLLARGKDPEKDQSYVLYGLGQDTLGHVMFPLGNLTKQKVREISWKKRLSSSQTPESQDICFVAKGGHHALFQRANFSQHPGQIVDTSGRVLGSHKGLAYYTVGQRRGLGVDHSTPLYVVKIDPDANEVIVGSREEAYSSGCYVDDLNFVMEDYPHSEIKGTCMVRYRGREVPATLMPLEVDGESRVFIQFDVPQFAVTPGQALVFYKGDYVYGGGTIVESQR